jgi:hypothetical protein
MDRHRDVPCPGGCWLRSTSLWPLKVVFHPRISIANFFVVQSRHKVVSGRALSPLWSADSVRARSQRRSAPGTRWKTVANLRAPEMPAPCGLHHGHDFTLSKANGAK